MASIASTLMGRTSGKQKALEAASQRDRELARLAQDRAQEEGRAASADAGRNYAAGKSVRGRRLLESAAAGGLASTLGAA